MIRKCMLVITVAMVSFLILFPGKAKSTEPFTMTLDFDPSESGCAYVEGGGFTSTCTAVTMTRPIGTIITITAFPNSSITDSSYVVDSFVVTQNGEATETSCGFSPHSCAITTALDGDTETTAVFAGTGTAGGVTVYGKGVSLHSLVNIPTENVSDRPSNINFPYGFFTFVLDHVQPGERVLVTFRVPRNDKIQDYWKKDNDGNWHNIVDSITHDGDWTYISFYLTEGGIFDEDSSPNDITDQGGPGWSVGGVAIPTLNEWGMIILCLLVLSLGVFMLKKERFRI
jgi:hypothetical protein